MNKYGLTEAQEYIVKEFQKRHPTVPPDELLSMVGKVANMPAYSGPDMMAIQEEAMDAALAHSDHKWFMEVYRSWHRERDGYIERHPDKKGMYHLSEGREETARLLGELKCRT